MDLESNSFNKIVEWGEHKIYKYDTDKFKFKEYFQNLYDIIDVGDIHKFSKDFDINNSLEGKYDDLESDLHKKFYSNIITIISLKY